MLTWSVPNSAATALYIGVEGEQYKETTEHVSLVGGVSVDANISFEISSAPVLREQAYESIVRNFPTPGSVSKSGGEGEMMEAILCGCPTWTLRRPASQRAAYRKHVLRAVGFRGRAHGRHKTHPNRAVLRMTKHELVETTVRMGQLWFVGNALVRQDQTCLQTGINFGRLGTRGLKKPGRPSKHTEDCLQESLRAVGAIPRKGGGTKRCVYGVDVKDFPD